MVAVALRASGSFDRLHRADRCALRLPRGLDLRSGGERRGAGGRRCRRRGGALGLARWRAVRIIERDGLAALAATSEAREGRQQRSALDVRERLAMLLLVGLLFLLVAPLTCLGLGRVGQCEAERRGDLERYFGLRPRCIVLQCTDDDGGSALAHYLVATDGCALESMLRLTDLFQSTKIVRE